MVLGQSLDMESSNKKINEKLLEKIQKNKTGQLIHASCTMPYSISKNFDTSVNNLISRFSLLRIFLIIGSTPFELSSI